MESYHEGCESILIIYDLSNPAQWSMAGQCVRCWGRERTMIHSLGAGRIVVELLPGGALELTHE